MNPAGRASVSSLVTMTDRATASRPSSAGSGLRPFRSCGLGMWTEPVGARAAEPEAGGVCCDPGKRKRTAVVSGSFLDGERCARTQPRRRRPRRGAREAGRHARQRRRGSKRPGTARLRARGRQDAAGGRDSRRRSRARRVRYWFARALLDRNGPGDRDRAQQMLTEARALSEPMGLHGQTRWIDAQLAR